MDSVSKQNIIQWLGPERYDLARRARREFADPQDSARGRDDPGSAAPNPDIHWEVTDHVMGLAIPSESKMGLLLEIYRDVPEYGLLLAINMAWFEFDEAAHARFRRLMVEETLAGRQYWCRRY
jgi:hypothetical protein